ncbi:hypothetical protein A1QO_00570 [Vibrio genomosp. F10 str. ZF-129]|uniref:AAA domain-containing protein n=1 Tax=Vibrio genomosp. F10 str. ZF-129 TaxID=1187848 RepID=A0A1E5BH81_9VIBR|nr:ParA family protein [Vibrio genomosp. F10]OEE35285.1 hypothetical protein A1QO_00570 [Vibrio genomosp. F10 str. ZF-129]
MIVEELNKLGKRASFIAKGNQKTIEAFSNKNHADVTYSSDELCAMMDCYAKPRDLREHLKKLMEDGVYSFDQLANKQYALTQDQVRWLADHNKQPKYEYKSLRAVVAAFLNLKGGVGKSTLTVNFAEGCTLMPSTIVQDKKILIIDLDPQASTTFHFLKGKLQENHISATQLMSMESDDINRKLIEEWSICKTNNANIDIIASSTNDGFVADTLYGLAEKQNIAVHDLLRIKVIEHIQDDYDYILLDVGPHLDAVLKTALGAIDGFFLPTTPKIIDFDSTLKFIGRWEDLFGELENEGYDLKRLKFIKGFLNMTSASSSSLKEEYNHRAHLDLRQIFKQSYIPAQLSDSFVHQRCMNYGYTVFSMSERGYKHYEIGDIKTFSNKKSELSKWVEQIEMTLIDCHEEMETYNE